MSGSPLGRSGAGVDHIEILRLHNRWRRGELDDMTYRPSAIGQAIDDTVAEVEQLRAAVRALAVAKHAVSELPEEAYLDPAQLDRLTQAIADQREAERRLLELAARVAA